MRDRTYQHRRAYAILGLRPGVSLEQVQKHYKVLVRRWHPDQYATDPSGQAVAGERMREINAAYHVVMQQPALKTIGTRTESRAGPRSPARRLSREEIDDLVRAIGTDGPVDHFLNAVGRIERTLRGILALAIGVVGLVSLFYLILASHSVGLVSGFVITLIVRDLGFLGH